MQQVKALEHIVLYRDEHAYCAHPHIVSLPHGEWVVVFNKGVRRPFILHPPHDPQYYNVVIRSQDGGRTWSAPRVAPGYDWYGVECAGLTVLSDGTLLLNQWQFRWYPLEVAQKVKDDSLLFPPRDLAEWWDQVEASGEAESYYGPPRSGCLSQQDLTELMPWARANGGTYIHRSTDGGRTWDETVKLDTTPYPGGYGMRGGAQLPNGDVLLPLSDVPNYQRVFVARSPDGGRTWGKPVEVAAEPGKRFEEPSILVLGLDRILLMLRENTTRFLHQSLSLDGGWTWTRPVQTPIWGYPAHLLALPDGRILCVYGHRRRPYGILAVLSNDQGESWDVDNTLIIRGDLPNADLGYPSSTLTEEGDIFTVYYGQDQDGVTCIWGTRFQV
jgi:hypothetical protein